VTLRSGLQPVLSGRRRPVRPASGPLGVSLPYAVAASVFGGAKKHSRIEG
jgi:hypothetical protein